MKGKIRFFKIIPFLIFLGLAILLLSGKSFLKNEKIGCLCENFEKATGDFDFGEKIAFFEGEKITAPSPLAELPKEEKIMGATLDQKWIEVDLSEQKLIAWEGDKIFLETPISSGKWYPTPKGEFTIWSKFKYTKMEGGIKGTRTYYYLPNVPYTMYFYKGFGLHGTYWHNNFGQPMSHGCVNLPTSMAEKLFWWTDPVLPGGKNMVRATKDNSGTKVVIHE